MIKKEVIVSGNTNITKFMGFKMKPVKGKYNAYEYNYQYFDPDSPTLVKKRVFFGVLKNEDYENKFLHQERFPFHKHWNWLMPVVEKISTIHHESFPINVSISGGGGAHIAINPSNCAGEEYVGELVIANTLNLNYFITDEELQYTNIEAVWLAVVEFIDWYNKKHK